MPDDSAVQHPASYRDPSGFIFTYKSEVYRQVNRSFQKQFQAFIDSGLYQSLVQERLLIAHEAVNENLTGDANWVTTIKPEQLSFVSYPYEWCFSMLKDAALLTLDLAIKALNSGFILKDASPYNVQLHNGRMIFIDTLSFEPYNDGEPWIAYRQFCESFLGPLALMHYTGLPLQPMMVAYPNGIPLHYVKQLLPYKSRFNLPLYLHIHLHASYAAKPSTDEKKTVLSKQKLLNILRGLHDLISSFAFKRFKNVWGGYYDEAANRDGYLEEKKTIIAGWLSHINGAETLIDIGGNTGEFAQLAGRKKRIICADGEHDAVEQLYQKIKNNDSAPIVPLLIDFTNPSPAIGFNNIERSSLLDRAASDVALMLALVHHLAIGKNIPFKDIAALCSRLAKTLIIEFVPKSDEKAQLLLHNKKDIYEGYHEEAFTIAFSSLFRIIDKRVLSSSARTLYLMERL